MENLTEKVKCFLAKYNLLNSPLLVAFSGGFDSMCLLEILHEINANVSAIHLNHGWRGDESDREELNCRNFCNERNIVFYSEKLGTDVKKTETAAREARYKFFEKCAGKFNAKAVLTAHNANDNAETVIYRIAKGTGIKGLSGISENRGIFYRPLLDVSRANIEEYCRLHNLRPNFDSSNNNTDYKRNHIRKNILPEIQKISPCAIEMINSLSKNARNDNEIIEEYIKTLENPYDTENFSTFSNALKTRLLYNLFETKKIEPDRKKIQRALEFIEENQTAKSGKTLSVSGKFRLFVNNKDIKFIEKKEKQEYEAEISSEGEYDIEGHKFVIEKFTGKVTKFPSDSSLSAYADLSGYSRLTIRTRREGDIIRPLGLNGFQKLKKYLNEKKIPPYRKDEMIFLTAGKEILWAPSLGISENIKVVTNPTHMLKLVIKEN